MRLVTMRDTAAQTEAEARDQAVRAVAWAIARSAASDNVQANDERAHVDASGFSHTVRHFDGRLP